MAINNFEINLPQELNLWAARVFKTVKQKFIDFEINMSEDKNRGLTGNLYRRMYWEVHNAAGGNPALIEFFYMKYGDYVQWGVGAGVPKWDVPQLNGRNVQPIKHPTADRKAKPYLRREVRYHAKWLLKRLAEHYAFMGNFYMVRGLSQGMGDPSVMNKWIEENKHLLTKGFLDLMKK